MKKIKYLFLAVIGILVLPALVNASTGTIKVTGSSSAVIGNTVTFTVNLASSTAIGSWQMTLNYDKSYLQLVSTNSEGNGTVMAASSASGIKSKSYTYKFKALKKGNTTVAINSYLAYAFSDLKEIKLTSTGKKITIMTQEELEATYSKDNNLQSLSVEGFTISPEFAKDVLEYNVVVPENTKEIKINAAPSDKKAAVNGTGTKEVTSGINSFKIIVSAENGSEKTYTINIDVKDENPIEVTINNKKYTVVKIKEYLPEKELYEEKTVYINEIEIPAYYNSKTKKTLVGLKDEFGKIDLFTYENNKYEKYAELNFGNIFLIPTKMNQKINGYTKTSMTINDVIIDAYKLNKKTNFAIISGINVATGEENLYLFDEKNKSVVEYDNEYVKILEEKVNLYIYIIAGFSLILLIQFILLISKKKQKK